MASEVKLDSPRSAYVLGLLTFTFALAFVDRQILNLLVDPVKRTLILSDTQFSLVQGLAFVSAYLLAIPVFGRLVDITNRRNILIFGVCSWSICTALCGLADTFGELFLARFGVGLSEACVFPVAWSLIGDYFSPRRSARAFSIFMLGSQVGSGVALIAGGAVIASGERLRDAIPLFTQLETWQMAFVVVGLPGLLLGLVLLTVREPVRQRSAVADEAEQHIGQKQAAAILWQNRAFYGRIYLGIGMLAVVTLGLPSWFPTFLIRAYEMPAADVGYRYGLLSITFSSTGILAGPAVARWLEKRGYIDAAIRVPAIAMVGSLVCCAALPLTGSATGAMIAAAGVIFFANLPTGVLAAATQGVTPSRLRGLVAALYSFAAQITGYGIAPTAVAFLTDRLFGDPTMVGYSLQIVTMTASAVAALMYFTLLRVYRDKLRAGEATASQAVERSSAEAAESSPRPA